MAISRSDMERQLRNMGGIMSLEDPRQGYFLGKLVRKAKKAVKKVIKSPIGKAAILGGLTFGIPGTQFGGFAGKGALGGLKGKLFGTPGYFNVGSALHGSGVGKSIASTSGILGKLGLTKGGGAMGLTGLGKIAGITGLSGLAGLLAAGEADEEDEIDASKLDRGEGLNILDIVARARKNDPEFRFLPGAEFTDMYAEGGDVKDRSTVKEIFDDDTPKTQNIVDLSEGFTLSPITILRRILAEKELEEKRKKKAKGGIMDLGGMEMDLRGGGFVPLGAKEKADDVPARLSKNEFVMTADAVRAAGGGSVDKGADKMYNMMKNLEAQV